MLIIVNGKKFTQDSIPFLDHLFSTLQEKGVDLLINESFFKQLTKKVNLEESVKTFSEDDLLPANAEYCLSIGGDGTLLESISLVGNLQIPIAGINTGRLGFLATISQQDTQKAIDHLINGKFEIQERTLVKLETDGDIFGTKNFALNEMTVLKRDSSSMIVVNASINGKFLNSYWADGLVISTPTGSTGYSLSCGGPVLTPEAKNFILSPVCPHNLNVRPIIVPDDSEIKLEIQARTKNIIVSLDSRSKIVNSETSFTVKKEKFCAKILSFEEYNFFNTLRTKLNWGLDVRN